jgi:hypothetical protein
MKSDEKWGEKAATNSNVFHRKSSGDTADINSSGERGFQDVGKYHGKFPRL